MYIGFIIMFIVIIVGIVKLFNTEYIKTSSNNKKSTDNDSITQETFDRRYMQKKDDIFEIQHFIIERFNIEFDITNDFLVDPVMTLLLVKDYGPTQVASFLMKDTDNTFTISYMGKSSLKTLAESNMKTWVNEVTQLGKCYYRKSIDNTMIMYGISFANNDTYTIAYKHNMVDRKTFDNCIEKIIQTMSIPEYINLEEGDKKILINFCDEAYLKYNKSEYKNFSYYCKENKLTKNVLLALKNEIKSFNLANEYIIVIEKYL